MSRSRRRKRSWLTRIAILLAAVPGLYLLAALVGGLVSINRGWEEPEQGVTIFLASNGVHVDLVLPARAEGLDWAPLLPRSGFRNVPEGADWIAFGAGERRVYLETPTWADISSQTAVVALTGGERVMHVQWVADPSYSAKEIRLTPEQYRRLWASIRAGFALDGEGKPVRLDHPGYGMGDSFYQGVGKANAIHTCNQWVAGRLRLAGVRTPLWSPFVQGLMWRYREPGQST